MKYLKQKQMLRNLVRSVRNCENIKRDEKLFPILSNEPYATFKQIKTNKIFAQSCKIQKLTVGNKVYHTENIPDGFYDSLDGLKTIDNIELEANPYKNDLISDYENIAKLCKN